MTVHKVPLLAFYKRLVQAYYNLRKLPLFYEKHMTVHKVPLLAFYKRLVLSKYFLVSYGGPRACQQFLF